MRCADDPVTPDGHPDIHLVAERTVQLCRVAEETWERHFNSHPGLVYVIGTEVPVPGGATEQENELKPTDVSAASETIEINRVNFRKAGMEKAWERVCGLVVQPGVEFGDDQVIRYNHENGIRLSRWILDQKNIVFEAHSTDYQTETSLRELVGDHFGILKVGPWLTFAFREALFALEAMEKEIPATLYSRSNLSETLESVMKNDDRYWKSHYRGDEATLRQKRQFSFSDRSRYYWVHPLIQQSINSLFTNLTRNPIPLSLLSQFMPIAYRLVSEGQTGSSPQELVHCHIRNVAHIYSSACGWKKEN
jgi:D-tagatose-1,6-bisphosphate aldolase subunit GatZ/KbaZ